MQALAYNKHPIFDSLQTIDNTETKVIARKPSEKQTKTGNYSRSNIKYLLKTHMYKISDCPSRLLKAIKKYYNSLEDAYKNLNIDIT